MSIKKILLLLPVGVRQLSLGFVQSFFTLGHGT